MFVGEKDGHAEIQVLDDEDAGGGAERVIKRIKTVPGGEADGLIWMGKGGPY